MENSELDLLAGSTRPRTPKDPEVAAIAARDGRGAGRRATYYPDLLPEARAVRAGAACGSPRSNLGSRRYAVFADKCWPAFEKAFGFVPCYVNSPPGDPGHAGRLRGGHLRRGQRVHLPARQRRRPPRCWTSTTPCPTDLIAPGTDLQGRDARGPVHGLPLRQHAELLHEELLDEVPAHHEPADGGPAPGSRTSPAARSKASCAPARPPSSACRGTRTGSWPATSPRATSSTSTRRASAASASSPSRTSPGSTATC